MKVAAFNVRNLGHQKVTDKMVSQYLTKIISQYSVIVILEVVDKSGKAMEMLLKKLNCTADHPYEMVCSSSLGRNTYKEQFVCFYRNLDNKKPTIGQITIKPLSKWAMAKDHTIYHSDKLQEAETIILTDSPTLDNSRADEVKLTAQYQYEDNQAGDEDAFAREPFILRFHCPSTVVKDLVLIPVHTKPEDSEKELDELYDVVKAVRRKWKTDNIMILGDFNADGRYLSKKKKKSIRISSDPFHWLIDDDVDTTTSNYNDNTYDRIVVYGEEMLDAIVPDSAKSFNFQVEFGLTDEEAGNISDHYPVEVELETVKKAVKPKKKALPQTTKTSPKRKGPKKGSQSRTKPSESKTSTAKKRKGQSVASKTPTKRRR